MPLPDAVRQRLQPLNSAVTSNRIALYSLFSTCAVVGTLANACRGYSNFYSVAIYLSKSSRSVLILANFGFLVALLCGRIMQRLFFGPLQPREIERLYDQTWIFVTESLLAFTIFRDDFDMPFVFMFGFLLFVKCFHWLMADRVETMDQATYPGPPAIFHIRMNLLFCLLWLVDIVMFGLAVESTLNHGVGGMVLFASEYSILMATALNSMARYILSMIDFRRARTRGGENAPPMENKSMYVFYIELVTDFLKLTTYLIFFMLILTFYGLPLNIVRDVYLTARSFITRLRALMRYRNATRDMDRRYPNATEAELSELSDRTCIICREEMDSRDPRVPAGEEVPDTPVPPAHDGPNMTPKKLPCGHIFHFQCLRSWLERQQSCPTCRRTVLETDPPNQAQGQGRPGGVGAPAPQPGVVPQVGQQPGGAAAWLGRMLGLPVQPPLVHGQFVNGQPGAPLQQQPPPQAPNVGWAQVPPPQFYYPIHYPQPAPPQQLHPVPAFGGFHGPNGVWQPWGVDPQRAVDAPQQPGSTESRQSQQSNGSAVGPTMTASEDTAHPQNSRLPSVPTPTSTAASSPVEPAPTPRDAAAQAALRRMGTSTATTVRETTSSESGVSSAAPRDSTAPAIASTPAQSGHTAAAGSGAQVNAGNAGPQVPSLIPLYDLGPSGPPMRAPPYVAPYNPYGAYQTFFRNPSQNNTRPQQGPSQAPSSEPRPASLHAHQPQYGAARYPRPAAPANRPPLSQLPATVTDEQLARLDRLTRDAIDERLRVLEGVSGAVYRCIEELTRVRSVLPIAAAVGSGTPQNQGPNQERSTDDIPAASTSSTAGASSAPLGHGEAGSETPSVDVEDSSLADGVVTTSAELSGLSEASEDQGSAVTQPQEQTAS